MAEKLYTPCDYGYLCEPVTIGDAEFDTTIPGWEWTAEIPTEGDAPTSAAVDGPDWMSLELDGNTLKLSGTPTEAGTYSFTVTAVNCPELGDTSDSKTFAMTVDPAVEFRYTVAPEEGGELSYCPVAPSYLSSGRLYVDWGDGSREVVPASGSDTFPTHEYATDDGTKYQITLSASDETWAGVDRMFFGTSTTVSLSAPEPDDGDAAERNDGTDGEESAEAKPQVLATKTDPADQTDCHVRYLVSVDDPLPRMGFTTGAYMFYNNRLLESVPGALFSARASECTSFAYCFYYCLSLKTPPAGLFAGCSAATSFNYCFAYCQNMDSETNFTEGLFSDCTAMKSADSCFYYAWLGNVTSTLFGAATGTSPHQNLTSVASCFNYATVGNVSSPLISNLSALTEISIGTSSGFFYSCTFGDVSSPLVSNLSALTEISTGTSSGFFRSCTFGDVSSPLISNLSALTSISTGTSSGGFFYSCTFNGTVSSALVSDLSALTSISTGTYGGVFYSCKFNGTISSALLSGLSALTTISHTGSSQGTFCSCTFGDVSAPLLSDLPKLTLIGSGGSDSSSGDVFYSCKFNGTISSALLSGLSALTSINVGNGNAGVFDGCTFGDIDVPLIANLSALETIGSSSSSANVFYNCTIGSIKSPVFSNLPKLVSIGYYSSNRGMFYNATWNGTIKSNLFESCPKLARLPNVFYYGYSGTLLTSVPSNVFANLPALEYVSYAFYNQTELTATIDLTGSDSITNASDFGYNSNITVKVTKGSTTDTTMSKASAYVTVVYG